MNILPKLSDHELHGVLLNALHCAAERYRENAKELRALGTHGRMAEQFERQAREAVALAERLEEESRES